MSGLKSDPIEAKRWVHVGQDLKLIQKVEFTLKNDCFFDSGRPLGLPQVEYAPQISRPGELPLERLTYSLETTKEHLFIENSGLCASYGIFGAPGSGKTFLLLYLLRQLLAMNKDELDLKFGALILDPKAALINDIQGMVKAVGREEDLVIINTDILSKDSFKAINVIDAGLDPYELGKQLVLAARSAGVSTSDNYWILAWNNLFCPATYLLSLGTKTVTLRALIDSITSIDYTQKTPEHPIQTIARQISNDLENLMPEEQQDTALAIDAIKNFFNQENRELATVINIIIGAYLPFQRFRYSCYSHEESKEHAKLHPTFYDQIIDEGKIVLVSLSPSEPAVAKTLCTLVKCLFQTSVLSRSERVRAGLILSKSERVRARLLSNNQRVVLLACDEYSQVASEVQGEPAGDGNFFSLSRQQKCMGILATQSVNVLQSSSLGENWRSVFSNFGGKFFMRLVDNQTIEEATKLAGESDWYVTTIGSSRSKDGLASSSEKDLRERKTLPSSILTQIFQRGDAVIIGSLDGSETQSVVKFVHVPKDPETYKEIRRDNNP